MRSVQGHVEERRGHSSRASDQASNQTRVLIDARPLQGADSLRGVGTYVRGLLGGLLEIGYGDRLTLLVDGGLPAPGFDLPLVGVRRRYRGRAALYEDAVVMGGDLERLRPSLYHATSLRLPGRAPCPLVVTLHDLIPWAYRGRGLRGERLRYWPGRRLLRRADAVLAVSDATAADAQRLAGVEAGRLQVVPEGVSSVFQPRDDSAPRVAARFGLQPGYLLYVGSLDARKDPGALLAAWRQVRSSAPDVRLVLAGSPGAQAPAQMAGAVRVGQVSEEELADLYSAAGCLVFPSRYEGFGLPLLEAMACGCPAVGYANSSLPEVAGEAAELVADGDAEALGRAAAGMLLEPARRDRARRRGIARARRFSWRRTAELTARAYGSLLHD